MSETNKVTDSEVQRYLFLLIYNLLVEKVLVSNVNTHCQLFTEVLGSNFAFCRDICSWTIPSNSVISSLYSQQLELCTCVLPRTLSKVRYVELN